MTKDEIDLLMTILRQHKLDAESTQSAFIDDVAHDSYEKTNELRASYKGAIMDFAGQTGFFPVFTTEWRKRQ